MTSLQGKKGVQLYLNVRGCVSTLYTVTCTFVNAYTGQVMFNWSPYMYIFFTYIDESWWTWGDLG